MSSISAGVPYSALCKALTPSTGSDSSLSIPLGALDSKMKLQQCWALLPSSASPNIVAFYSALQPSYDYFLAHLEKRVTLPQHKPRGKQLQGIKEPTPPPGPILAPGSRRGRSPSPYGHVTKLRKIKIISNVGFAKLQDVPRARNLFGSLKVVTAEGVKLFQLVCSSC